MITLQFWVTDAEQAAQRLEVERCPYHYES